MKRAIYLTMMAFLLSSFMPQVQADKEKVSIRLEQAYDIDPTKNRVKMTFRVFMENTDAFEKESYSDWSWEFGFTLNDIKVYDAKGDLKYDYDKKDIKITVHFTEEIAYGGKYEYTIEGVFPLNEIRAEYCYRNFESLGIVYIPFKNYPTRLIVTFPKNNYVELPFKSKIKEEGDTIRAEADVSKMEYTVLFVENRKYEKVVKKVRLQKREYEIVAAGVDAKWSESAANVNMKLLPYLEEIIKLPFPDNIDRFIIYQVKESEGGNCWWGFHWGTSIVTWERTENGLYELLAHEFAHHWFSRDSQWINEGNANLCEYLALNKFEFKDFAERSFLYYVSEGAKLQNVPLSTASYDKYRQAVYAAGFMFMYDLHQRYGMGGLQKFYKSIVPEEVNSFEFYYYATKSFGEGVSSMFERRVFPKEDMPKIMEFKKSYEEYLEAYKNVTGLYERNGMSTKAWREGRDKIRKQIDEMDFDAAKIREEIDMAKNAEAALKKYGDFVLAMKEKGIALSDEQTSELRGNLTERDFSSIDADIEKLASELPPPTTTTPETKPPETASPPTPAPHTELPTRKTDIVPIAIAGMILAIGIAVGVLWLRRKGAEQKMRSQRTFCPNCGKENTLEDKFCMNCGSSLK